MNNVQITVDSKTAKIAKLLKQAERAGTEEEAAVFMEKANKLAATYQVDMALARAHTAKSEKRPEPIMRKVDIGQRRAKYNKQYIELFYEIASAYGLRMDIAHNNTAVWLFGFETDVDVVESLYASLLVQMGDAGNRYIAKGTYREEHVWSNAKGEFVPMHGLTARMAFNTGFTNRVGTRLKVAIYKTRQEIRTHELEEAIPSGTILNDALNTIAQETSSELALRATELEVTEFHARTSRAKGAWKGSTGGSGGRGSEAHDAGTKAGDKANLGGQRAIGN